MRNQKPQRNDCFHKKYRVQLLRYFLTIFIALSLVEKVVATNEVNKVNKPSSKTIEVITLAGGCFWCIEAVFDLVQGVKKAESGYAGGPNGNPTYEEVCSGSTGHAEVVQVTFDPQVISLSELLEIFFTIHDPTTLNRQGNDIGTQYRSAIFYHSTEQKDIAEKVIRNFESSNHLQHPVVTEVSQLTKFYKAENYHQEYFRLNGTQSYCSSVIAPKVAKFRKQFSDKLK